MTDLSPAAQAVLEGFRAVPTLMDAPSIAGALRAAADQVVPVEPEPPELPFPSVNDPWPHWNAKQDVRAKLLAIAAELEASQ
jgi:hypothetical protein